MKNGKYAQVEMLMPRNQTLCLPCLYTTVNIDNQHDACNLEWNMLKFKFSFVDWMLLSSVCRALWALLLLRKQVFGESFGASWRQPCTIVPDQEAGRFFLCTDKFPFETGCNFVCQLLLKKILFVVDPTTYLICICRTSQSYTVSFGRDTYDTLSTYLKYKMQ